ncbi:MAG: hypothetical protein HY907_18365 [Deltaproteobacteria bacterium]|nr:hypothetical protein [Deltaproteobacteria bacterium]
MKRLGRVVPVLAALVLAGACGDAGSAPVGLESYCASYARIACDFGRRCDCLMGFTEEMCRSVMAAECTNDVVTPVNEGRRSYDADAAGDCLAGLRTILADCNLDDVDYPMACETMLSGTTRAGGSCDEDGDCLPVLECYDNACIAAPVAGEPCVDGTYCPGDLFCADDERCAVLRGPGQPCPEGDGACADGLYCDNRTATCSPYGGVGAECRHDNGSCADGLYCAFVDGVCQPLPGDGGDCTQSSGACAEGLYCDPAGRVCHPQLGAGAGCTDDGQCLSDFCDGGTCSTPADDRCPL